MMMMCSCQSLEQPLPRRPVRRCSTVSYEPFKVHFGSRLLQHPLQCCGAPTDGRGGRQPRSVQKQCVLKALVKFNPGGRNLSCGIAPFVGVSDTVRRRRQRLREEGIGQSPQFLCFLFCRQTVPRLERGLGTTPRALRQRECGRGRRRRSASFTAIRP